MKEFIFWILITALLSIPVTLAGFKTRDAWTKMTAVASEPIAITPRKINLVANKEWKNTQTLEIKNIDSKKTLYAVWIKIKTKDTKASLEGVKITAEKKDELLSKKTQDLAVNYDAVIISGFSPDQSPVIYVVIYRIESNESKYFQITSDEQIDLLLDVQAVGFSDVAQALVEKRNKGGVGLTISPPESFTIKSFTISMEKET